MRSMSPVKRVWAEVGKANVYVSERNVYSKY